MCGIAGLYYFNRDETVGEPTVKGMTDAIAHRGPDNQGVFLHRQTGLGYRRLSIIDTTEQSQPILTNESQSLRISFNGEIYNYQSIKEKLLERGHQFYTGTDTETIVHLYEDFQGDCVKELNGIFAFILADLEKNSLFIARDHIGIKPMYYVHTPKGFACASEIKSLLTLPWVTKKINYDALQFYLRYRFVPDPLTMFEGIYKLPPGHTMTVSESGVEIREYWDLSTEIREHRRDLNGTTEGQCISVVHNTVSEAVKRQLIADVPVGAFLSGGIDSSIVVGLMSQFMSQPVKTFSIGFTERDFDETNYARMISKRFGTDHEEILLTPNHVKQLPAILWHLDEPLADPAAVPTFFLSEETRKKVTVVLTGEGGDELFAGYKEDFPYRVGALLHSFPSELREMVAKYLTKLPISKGKTRLYRSILSDAQRAEHILTDVFRFEEPPVNRDLIVDSDKKTYSFDEHWQKTQGMDWLEKMMYLETRIWLPGDPLMKVDKMSMAHGLEARVPLLDMEVVRVATQIPSSLKNNQGIEKYLLRKAFEDLLPNEIYTRKKTAFELPVGRWLQDPLSGYLEEYLSQKKLARAGCWDIPVVREMLKMHHAGKKDYRYELWAILTFQIWYDKWFA